MSRKPPPLDTEKAEAIALRALAFLAEDTGRLGRFLGLTGLTPDDLRSGAGTVPVQQAVLEHLLGDESLLLVFAATQGIPAEDIPTAHALLSRG